MQTQKSTKEIKELLSKAEINFDSAVNAALNAHLPKLLMTPLLQSRSAAKNNATTVNPQTSNRQLLLLRKEV